MVAWEREQNMQNKKETPKTKLNHYIKQFIKVAVMKQDNTKLQHVLFKTVTLHTVMP